MSEQSQLVRDRVAEMRQVAVIGLCFWLSVSSIAQAAPSAAANAELVTRAERLLARGYSKQALVLLRRAYARAPSLALALKLASALLPDPGRSLHIKVPVGKASPSRKESMARETGMLREQARELVQLVDNLPLSASFEDQPLLRKLWRRRAWAQAWVGDFAGAVSSLRERGGSQDGESSRYLRSVAALAVRHDDLRAAEEGLRAARSFMPQDTELAADLAALLLAQGRAEESIPLWQEALRKNEQDLEARRDLASALLAAGRGAEAWQLLEAQRAACDVATNCAIEAARAALELGEPQTAVARLTGPFAGNVVEAQFVLADAHTRLGAWQQAREAYARILALKPSNVRARENLRALEESAQETQGH